MTDKPPIAAPDFEAWIDAMAPVMGITVDPAWRAGIVQNLQVTHRLAALVLELPMDEREEPAPVYQP